METSRYFERTLFYDRSPAADEYYERSSKLIFEKDPARSDIEVRVQSSVDVLFWEKKDDAGSIGRELEEKRKATIKPQEFSNGKANSECITPKPKTDSESESEDTRSLSSKASSTALPTGLDERRGVSPPSYPGMPKLKVVSLDRDIEKLKHFIKVSQYIAIRCSSLICCAQETNENFRVLYVVTSLSCKATPWWHSYWADSTGLHSTRTMKFHLSQQLSFVGILMHSSGIPCILLTIL
jgi:hypothetical protein